MATVFSLSILLVMPFWLLMIFVPQGRWTRRIMTSPSVVLPAAILYAVLVLPHVRTVWPDLMNPRLPAIAALLGTEHGATIGWVHFLAFDLFVGRWVYLDSRERRISAWWTSPMLCFVFILGPLGLLLYLVVRQLHGWRRAQKVSPG